VTAKIASCKEAYDEVDKQSERRTVQTDECRASRLEKRLDNLTPLTKRKASSTLLFLNIGCCAETFDVRWSYLCGSG